MKGFLLDSKGDVVISNTTHEIQMTAGNELLAQTVRQVLSTNKGEWFLNQEEGINFKNLLGKTGKSDESLKTSNLLSSSGIAGNNNSLDPEVQALADELSQVLHGGK